MFVVVAFGKLTTVVLDAEDDVTDGARRLRLYDNVGS